MRSIQASLTAGGRRNGGAQYQLLACLNSQALQGEP
jgi:hypothetical protein